MKLVKKGELIPPEERVQEIGIAWVRLGDSDPLYSLDGIFLNNSKDADDKSNYDFTVVDKAFDSAIKHGAEPVFFLLADINCFKHDCGENYPERTGIGYKPDDYDKWVDVVINVIKHFNGMFEVEKQARNYSKGDVKYISI